MSGIGTRLLQLTINDVERTAEISTGKITSGDAGSDFTTFEDAANGGRRKYQLVFTAVQDGVAASLWDEVFSNAGDDVPFILDPYGAGDTPTPTKPVFVGVATISEPDGDFIGGDANTSTTARMTFSCAWDCEAKPTRVTDPDDLP